jgi:hypothetical protein
MTQVSVTNRGLAPRVFKTADARPVVLDQGQSSTFHVHPHHAHMLLRESRKAHAQVDVLISASEMEAMQGQLSKMRQEAPQPKSGTPFILQPARVDETRRMLGMAGNRNRQFITDPQTVHPSRQPKKTEAETDNVGRVVVKKKKKPKSDEQ